SPHPRLLHRLPRTSRLARQPLRLLQPLPQRGDLRQQCLGFAHRFPPSAGSSPGADATGLPLPPTIGDHPRPTLTVLSFLPNESTRPDNPSSPGLFCLTYYLTGVLCECYTSRQGERLALAGRGKVEGDLTRRTTAGAGV